MTAQEVIDAAKRIGCKMERRGAKIVVVGEGKDFDRLARIAERRQAELSEWFREHPKEALELEPEPEVCDLCGRAVWRAPINETAFMFWCDRAGASENKYRPAVPACPFRR